VVVVVPAAAVEEERSRHRCAVVAGGPSRTASVRAGLEAVPVEAQIICIHDAARPLATEALFGRVIAAVRGGASGAVPAVPVNDTIKVVIDGWVDHTPDRTTLMAVQTPQAFEAIALREAHRLADEHGVEGTDDASLLEHFGHGVEVVAGEIDNRKITIADDLDWVRNRRAHEATARGGASGNLTEQ
jgi:2-C-methyl-D-erythritol 4-phosphate cytidylyltransferase